MTTFWQRKRSIRVFIPTVLVAFLGSCASSAPVFVSYGGSAAGTRPPAKQEELRAHFSEGEILVDVFPRQSEGYIELAIRISNQPKNWQRLRSWNKNARYLKVGVPVQVPFSYLNARYRLLAVQTLFRHDRMTATGWQHRVTYRGETMWFLSETFTGDGNNYPEIQRANGMAAGEALKIGATINIPIALLSEEYTPALPDTLEHPDLTFEYGADGKLYAVYELKQGEALYSSVVVRFTGRVESADVDEMTQKILQLNNLSDPRKIPTGYKVRIPFEDLSDDFMTSGAPDRVVKVTRPRKDSKIHVIIDPGHGGADPGAIKNGIAEDELAYDVMLRLKKILERRGATVYSTITDPDCNGEPQNSRHLRNGRDEQINTRPPYTIRDSRLGVNLRVYLVNAIYNDLRRKGIDDDQIFFISIHMDVLHPSMSGAMIYYPNANERRRTFKVNGSAYGRFAESRNVSIDFPYAANRKAESYSYDFSRKLIESFRKNRIPVHSYRPIRPYVYRKNQKWTPGIIRYSRVPTSILLEVVNIANNQDFARIIDYRFRQKVAEAVADVIL